MKLIFDTDTAQLIVAEGFASPVSLLEAKRGTDAKIHLVLLRASPRSIGRGDKEVYRSFGSKVLT